MEKTLQILVIDDEAIAVKRLKAYLEKLNYLVEGYENPLDALQRIKEKDFDIVITDVRMNEIDGIEILSEVRAKSERTKVIMITGYAMMELARQAMEKGAYDFIAKPFKPEELLRVVLRAADTPGS
ncbi:MAG: response regulator [Nitrospirae bacterium YQR-1]